MKRFLIMFLVLGLVVGSLATAEAANKKKKQPARVERTVTGSYATPVIPFEADRCSQSGGRGCVAIRTGARESFFTAKATDAHGLPVLVQVWTSTDRDGIEDVHFGTFCGETTQPISFPPGTELHFWVGFTYSFAPYESCPGGTIATTGTVSVTLTDKPAIAEGEVLRSGSVLSGDGWFLDSTLGGCQMAPDCIAWLESDCDPALSGRDPGFMASIVDVSNLADGSALRNFKFGAGRPWGPVWGGAQVQFWDRGCNEVRSMRWRSTDCDGDASGRDCSSFRFRIPPSVKWMTVTGYQDNVNLAWTLT